MMKKIFNKGSALFLLLVFLAAIVSACGSSPTPDGVTTPTAGETAAPAGADTTLMILHLNDTHGRTRAEPYISQMAKDMRAAGENVLLFDAGDRLHGQTATNLTNGLAMTEVMNAVGYDAMVPGNHDFNFGLDRLLDLGGMMDFPLLASNVIKDEAPRQFERYTIFEFDGVKVGVFGLVTQDMITKTDPRIVAGLSIESPEEIAAEYVELLKGKDCAVIIALAHLGLDELQDFNVPGIDVIIDGHSHTALENGEHRGDTLIAQAGAHGENIGFVHLTVADGRVTRKTASLVTLPDEDGDPDNLTGIVDEDIIAVIEAAEKNIEPITEVVVGNTPVLLDGARENVRTGETNLANLVTDSMRHATGADIAFLTGGNIRASIEAGDITMGDVLTVLPFSNLLVTVEMKGSDILEILEHGVAQYPEEAGQHIQVSGLSFAFMPPKNVIMEAPLLANGSPLDPDETYIVATIEFLAAGGDNYRMMVERGTNLVYYQGDAEALAEYLETGPEIKAEAEGRVSAGP